MNQVNIIGELVEEPKKTEDLEDKLLNISLKVKRNYDISDKTFDIVNVLIEQNKELGNLILKKGNKFFVKGKIISFDQSKEKMNILLTEIKEI